MMQLHDTLGERKPDTHTLPVAIHICIPLIEPVENFVDVLCRDTTSGV